MKIKVFGKKECALCQATKNKLMHFLEKWNYDAVIPMEFVDLDTIEGMAEGAYNDVLKVPTTIIEDEGSVIARWEKEIPNSEEVKKYFERTMEKV
ncbi:MAG: thioredoxin family protein [Candidatus Omnitrophica bacterium]|nr:thioredoxin family protein [Candidatus Omnitrophota bacterium]